MSAGLISLFCLLMDTIHEPLVSVNIALCMSVCVYSVH